MDTTLTRAAELRGQIQEHRERYYVASESTISDAEFDALVRELEQLEQGSPVPADSPTQTVGDDRTDGFAKAKHSLPMLSLKNVYSREELKAWLQGCAAALGESVSTVASIKVDGVALELVYENGKLQRAITRGDGIEGDDVTENVKQIKSVPQSITEQELIEVRGEVYFGAAGFKAANAARIAEGKEAFANPRNGAAGTLKHSDPAEVGRRGLSFLAHSLGRFTACSTLSGAFCQLLDLGIPVVKPFAIVDSEEDLWNYVEQIDGWRKTIDFPTDGVVIAVNSWKHQAELSVTGHSPRWAVAYKFPAERAETHLKAITVQIGRTGKATPVAELEPVKLAGTTVSRATLHNDDECVRLGVYIGAKVTIEKGGEIIPKVINVVPDPLNPTVRFWRMPKACPECGSPLAKHDEDGANHYCDNPSCPAKIIGWLLHWGSRDVMNIMDFGPAVADKLVRQLDVRSPAGLYNLDMDDLVNVAGMGMVESRKLLTEILKSKDRPFSCTIDGLGITGIGTTMSRELVKHFADIHALVNASDAALLAVPGFGKKTRLDFQAWLNDEAAQQILEDLILVDVRMKRSPEEEPVELSEEAAAHPFFGKTLVFTGALGVDRSEAEFLAAKKGAKCSGSVSKKTHLVIAGPGAGSKLDKAAALGVEVIDEAEFFKRLNN